MKRSALTAIFVGVGCASAPTARPPGSAVEFSEVLPADYQSLGTVSAACRAVEREDSLSDVPATSLACGRAELERALTEQVNERGGSMLAREHCTRTSRHLTCSGLAARPARASVAAGSAARVLFDDDGLPATVASRVLIDVGAKGARFDRRARRPDEVSEFAALPVGHVELGVMRAHCEPDACDDAQARAGLRLAAGGLGVSDLVGVRCFALDGERSCVGTLAVSERDAETDPTAR